MTLEPFLGGSGLFGVIGLAMALTLWFSLTIFILCVMEVSPFFWSARW
jgi:hypothetical protein